MDEDGRASWIEMKILGSRYEYRRERIQKSNTRENKIEDEICTGGMREELKDEL